MPWFPITSQPRSSDDLLSGVVCLPRFSCRICVGQNIQDAWGRTLENQRASYFLSIPWPNVWHLLPAELGAVGREIFCCCALLDPLGTVSTLVWHLSPTHLPWSLFGIQEEAN